MRKTFLYLAALSLVMPQLVIPVFAQTTISDSDPMAYAKSLYSTQSNSSRNSEEYFTHNYGSETAVPKQIIKKLTAKYGPPKTGRGDLRVWEVKDAQNRNVTIMVGSNKAGQQEYIIDKRSPLRRTYAPNRKPSKATSKKAPKPRKQSRSKASFNERD